ncbi:pentapeptide repeat-containing protein [Streptomyces sp. NBC_01728]|uniref:pentapeptide repeat-containing protein n=1 Tax=unclassified Streptomyces TaxID=2593676 RepID=UPI0022509496|nr:MULTISPECIES: pentapeptide repeat-containing protein [unclassified Streptomyces]MCX4458738.1 pentapeptide repeat-containing protein [Streptomyces sp. NBC_01719]MCX4498095.1 pentapeptide repeat-containing protein [Streptomyces sp. NBC_01728]
MSTPPAPIPSAPDWPHCGHGADPAVDPVGCRGIHVPGQAVCLAHVTDAQRTAYLATLAAGIDIDHRGTPFTQPLLDELLNALRAPTTGRINIGDAQFEEAQFSGQADFEGAQFSSDASFGMAQFSGPVRFDGAQFSGYAGFHGTQFSGDAGFSGAQFSSDSRFDMAQFNGSAWFKAAQFSGEAGFIGAQFSGSAHLAFSGTAHFVRARFGREAHFDGAQFSGEAHFNEAQFSGSAWFGRARFNSAAQFTSALFSGGARFDGAQFSGYAWFHGAQFSGYAWFHGAQFSEDAWFVGAQFNDVSALGPAVCASRMNLSGAVFTVPLMLQVAARELVCDRTQWQSTATVRVRYARVDLTDAVLSAPFAVTAHPAPFTAADQAVDETLLASRSPKVAVASVQGVDAAHLVLTDTDLSECLFTGAFHLDQIRLEGRTTFAPVPQGIHRRHIWPVRWSPRRTLAEEHHWRAQVAGQPAPSPGQTASPRRWRTGPHHGAPARTPDPEDMAAVYRQLRKAFEDGKNEPGAADFYYGEMEMRRHDRTGTPRGERGLLWGYWLLSGYGLRSSRAFSWLLATMSLTVLLLMGFGLPTHDPHPATTGTLAHGKISLNTSTPDPALNGGWQQRMTWPRAEKATRVALNSVIFRASGQNLTTAGTYIEMTSRLLEPTLLALAALAVRGRIKR